ncbi:MAG: DNA primase [Clostridia bacterium]|nr:DNA primase [Clostridia bacterium]
MAKSYDFPFGILDVAMILCLQERRPHASGGYYDCPFCGDKRGKMSINTEIDTWRCNYCSEHGGMLSLYARIKHISTSDAYREICDILMNGEYSSYSYNASAPASRKREQTVQTQLADIKTVHNTLSAMLDMLTLTKAHREHLKNVRGLTDEQINELKYRSTPPFYYGKKIAKVLIEKGYTVKGVPGFYVKDGVWTVSFSSKLSGILIPVRGIDRTIRGMQIRLDVPIKDEGADEDKSGTKYVWLSSSGKDMGVSSGSPVHFVGDPFARTVFITEGFLKADVSHYLMNRSFLAIAGINNTAKLELIFNMLKANGTQIIVEAADMDKFRNENVSRGVSNIYMTAKKCGLEFRRLTWNPNYKGIDDWQLALKRKNDEKEGYKRMDFKKRFVYGLCAFDTIEAEIERWKHIAEPKCTLAEYLGFTEEEFCAYGQADDETFMRDILTQRRELGFRIYQLDFSDGKTKPFAFAGIKALRNAGYEQPPATEYALIHEGTLFCFENECDRYCLELIYNRFNDTLPKDYVGRSVSPSDVIELYDEDGSRYYYCDICNFCEVSFSPELVKKMK